MLRDMREEVEDTLSPTTHNTENTDQNNSGESISGDFIPYCACSDQLLSCASKHTGLYT